MPEVSLHTAVKGQFGLGTGRAMGKYLRAFILKMFLGRPYRKKRKVLLPDLRTPPNSPARMSLWRPPAHNVPGQEQQWFRSCLHAHGAFCGCGNFILHLSSLAARLNFQGGPPPPGGPRAERPPLRALLPLPAVPGEGRENRPWPGGDGAGEGGSGREGGDGGPAVADEYRPEDLEDLFAAIEGDE